jgi:hypothetical protein
VESTFVLVINNYFYFLKIFIIFSIISISFWILILPILYSIILTSVVNILFGLLLFSFERLPSVKSLKESFMPKVFLISWLVIRQRIKSLFDDSTSTREGLRLEFVKSE